MVKNIRPGLARRIYHWDRFRVLDSPTYRVVCDEPVAADRSRGGPTRGPYEISEGDSGHGRRLRRRGQLSQGRGNPRPPRRRASAVERARAGGMRTERPERARDTDELVEIVAARVERTRGHNLGDPAARNVGMGRARRSFRPPLPDQRPEQPIFHRFLRRNVSIRGSVPHSYPVTGPKSERLRPAVCGHYPPSVSGRDASSSGVGASRLSFGSA